MKVCQDGLKKMVGWWGERLPPLAPLPPLAKSPLLATAWKRTVSQAMPQALPFSAC